MSHTLNNTKYKIIYADPPWQFNNKNTGGSLKSGASNHYTTMSLKDICNLPINKIADDDCVLFLWWVASMPYEALSVIESWGFKLKTMSGFDWIKLTKNKKLDFGMGFWTRQGSEDCLIAVKGKPKRINASIRNVVLTTKNKHSEKPQIFRDLIVQLMGDIPRIELFARISDEGWDTIQGEDKADGTGNDIVEFINKNYNNEKNI